VSQLGVNRMERLQRVLAERGVASRRKAEELIRAGRVSVDGKVVTELGTKVDPERAVIRVDGEIVRPQRKRYILLHKPRGYITTTRDERGRWTVMDLVQVPERVYPVGRLDRDTEGLLLLTNDGDLANRVMHPRFELVKEYHVYTPVRPSPATLERLRKGIAIEGRRVVPEEVRPLRETPEGVIVKIVLHEGRYHIVRRLMQAAGIPVNRLRRVRIGPLSIAGLPVGAWRDLTPGELATLFEAVHFEGSLPPVEPGPRVIHRTRPYRGRQRAESASDGDAGTEEPADARVTRSPEQNTRTRGSVDKSEIGRDPRDGGKSQLRQRLARSRTLAGSPRRSTNQRRREP